MAVIPNKSGIDANEVFVRVDCPNCKKNIRYKLSKPETRKLCKNCGKVSYVFTITPLRGALQITCAAENGFFPVEIQIKSEDVEINPEQ